MISDCDKLGDIIMDMDLVVIVENVCKKMNIISQFD